MTAYHNWNVSKAYTFSDAEIYEADHLNLT
jgi:hypothetical protein